MPTLVILRHAEAVPSSADDHARPLTEQGRADARSSGAQILATTRQPLLVLASDARRTRETAAAAFVTAMPAPDIRAVAALYTATVDILLKTLREVPGSHDTIVLVGHNPGLSKLAQELFREGAAEDRARVEAGLPTAGVALYTFEEAWPEIRKHRFRLRTTFTPDGRTWSA